MIFKATIYSVSLLIFAILAFSLSAYTFKKNKNRRINIIFGILTFIVGLDFICEGFESFFIPYSFKLFFSYFTFIMLLVPAVATLLISDFTGEDTVFKRKNLLLFLIIPVILLILGLTNPWLHLLWNNAYPINVNHPLIYYRHTPLILGLVYCVLMTLMPIYMLIDHLKNDSNIFRTPFHILLFSVIPPLIAVIYTFLNPITKTPVNPIAIGFVICLLLLYIAVFQYGLLDILPFVYESFINEVNLGMMFFNENDELVEVNKAVANLGISQSDSGLKVYTIFKDLDKFLDFYQDDDSDSVELEYENRWFELKKENIYEDKTFLGKIISVNDITYIQKLIEDNDNLIHDTNQRVKHNLLIIQSILRLQSHYTNDSNVKEDFDDVIRRISSMTLIHEELAISDSVDNIEIKNYLTNFLDNLYESFSSEDKNIKLNLNIEKMTIDVNIAITLGLLINEIVTNAFKYAFVKSNKGEINVDFHKKLNKFHLSVFDNGIGLPEDCKENTTTLGLTLIHTLSAQLDGELNINNENGTKYDLIFEDKDNDY